MTEFNELGLSAPIQTLLAGIGYTTPTPIQAQAIPPVLAGRDVLGLAQTGTGKTAAFALPIIHRLLANRTAAPRRGCHVLVLSPTRELASQIAASFRDYSRGFKLSVATVFGGVSAHAQIKALAQGVDILVATPGRLIDHLQTGAAQLRETPVLVLDEVDQMLDLGFVKPIRRIVAGMPKMRQNLFFSATMPEEILALARDLLVDPVSVSVAPAATTVERVAQRALLVETSGKRALLAGLFADPAYARTIVFTRTKRGADHVSDYLIAAGIDAQAIHGNKSQAQRERALAAFRAGRARALVATDIAARGIDIDAVSHVINYELPEVADSYVHRIGRTARAGAEGIAISLVDHGEMHLLRGIERLIRQKLPLDDRRADPRRPVTDDTRSQAGPQRRPSYPQRRPGQDGQNGHNQNGYGQKNGQRRPEGSNGPRRAAR